MGVERYGQKPPSVWSDTAHGSEQLGDYEPRPLYSTPLRARFLRLWPAIGSSNEVHRSRALYFEQCLVAASSAAGVSGLHLKRLCESEAGRHVKCACKSQSTCTRCMRWNCTSDSPPGLRIQLLSLLCFSFHLLLLGNGEVYRKSSEAR